MTRVSVCNTYHSEATAFQVYIPRSIYNLRLPGCQDSFLEIYFFIMFLSEIGFCFSHLGLGFTQNSLILCVA